MKKTLLIVGALVCFGAGAYSAETISGTVQAMEAPEPSPAGYEKVAYVKDGDTFEIAAEWSPYDLKWSVRVLGIDTPEKGYRAKCEREKRMSAKATALTERLIQESGNNVRLERVKHDKYGGRINASVVLADGSRLEDHLVQAGLAKLYNGGGPKPSWCY